MSDQFPRNLTKGKIAETIFWLMFRDTDFTILPFGYEYTMVELTQYRSRLSKQNQTVNNISHFPDFILISSDKKTVLSVEVKYRRQINFNGLVIDANETFKNWPDCYYFVATAKGFHFDTCKSIIESSGRAKPLSNGLVSLTKQKEYLHILKEFMQLKVVIENKSIFIECICSNCSVPLRLPVMNNRCPECKGEIIEVV